MKIILNGKKKVFKNSLTLLKIIQQSCRQPEYVIAEVNGKIIKSPLWGKTTIKNNDIIELVSFVGGG
ncbi:MAG TPA: sulfur carrier protein ThiS [Candidatus Omnitrophota bacterium]|nr:sulfur carrier protein ThiS [Candidatus Omnitrophota bacterium]HPN88237.1 sulfur carrier protein ThiS [Candidatus Omnitrophota bacterium]